MTTVTSPPSSTKASQPAAASTATRTLLLAGVVAGPLYVTTSLVQAVTREDFDPTRHAWSMLANGDLGWIQATNLHLTGLLVLAFALGTSRVLRRGPASTWAPRLLAVFGAGMLIAGFFPADPGLGFPPGTPADHLAVSASGVAHMLSATVGFAGVVGACLVLARRLAAAGDRGWARASRLVGAFFLVSFVGLAATGSTAGVLAFTLGVVAVFTWLALLGLRYRRLLQSGDSAAGTR